MKKIVVRYGLMSGLLSAGAMLITGLKADKIGFDNASVIGYIAMVLAFTFMYFGMVSYKNARVGARISFGKALSIGVQIMFISCFCYAITWVVLYHTIFPDFFDNYMTYAIAKMHERRATSTEIYKQMQAMQQYKETYNNHIAMFLTTFIEPLPVGVPVAFISALLAQVRRKTVED